jgi:transposase
MRFVPVKSAEQQAGLMMVSVRESLVRQRTRLSNAIRGHAAEFGLIAPKGTGRVEDLLHRAAEDAALPPMARRMFERLGRQWAHLADEVDELERELEAWCRSSRVARRLVMIPSVGTVGAALLVLKAPDPSLFKSARHFAAWLGLTPKDHSTAGKHRLGVITRAGDEALRSNLVVGATSLLQKVRLGQGLRSPWLTKLMAKKEMKEVAVALANKVARIAWRMMLTGEAYDPSRLMRPMPLD